MVSGRSYHMHPSTAVQKLLVLVMREDPVERDRANRSPGMSLERVLQEMRREGRSRDKGNPGMGDSPHPHSDGDVEATRLHMPERC